MSRGASACRRRRARTRGSLFSLSMTSDWVANRLLLVGNQALLQIPLENFPSQSVVVPKQLITLSVGAQDAKQLTFDPFTKCARRLAAAAAAATRHAHARTLQHRLPARAQRLTVQPQPQPKARGELGPPPRLPQVANGHRHPKYVRITVLHRRAHASAAGEFVWNRPSSPTIYALTVGGRMKVGEFNLRLGQRGMTR